MRLLTSRVLKIAGELSANFFAGWRVEAQRFFQSKPRVSPFTNPPNLEPMLNRHFRDLRQAASEATLLLRVIESDHEDWVMSVRRIREGYVDFKEGVLDSLLREASNLGNAQGAVLQGVHDFILHLMWENGGVPTTDFFYTHYPSAIPPLAPLVAQILRQADSETLAELEHFGKDLQSQAVNGPEDYPPAVLGFFRRANLPTIARSRVIYEARGGSAHPTFGLDTFEALLQMLESEVRSFAADPVFQEFAISGGATVVVNASEPDLTPALARQYAQAFDEAAKIIVSEKLGKLLNGLVIFLESTRHTRRSQDRVQGWYDMDKDTITLSGPPWETVETLVHELGHRYWTRYMSYAQRKSYNDVVQINSTTTTREHPASVWRGGERNPVVDEAGRRVVKPAVPVSRYGETSIEEAFAEAFKHFILEKDMTRSQIETFTTTSGIRKGGRLERLTEGHPHKKRLLMLGSNDAIAQRVAARYLLATDPETKRILDLVAKKKYNKLKWPDIKFLFNLLGGSIVEEVGIVPFDPVHQFEVGDSRYTTYLGPSRQLADAKHAEFAQYLTPSLPSSPAHGRVYITELGPVEQVGSQYRFKFDGGMGNLGFRFTVAGNTYFMLPLTSDVISPESGVIRGPVVLGATLEQVSEDWLNDIEEWFKEIQMHNVAKTHMGQAPTQRTSQNRENTGTCSACFDNVKLRKSGNKTLLAVHGYNRDGSGTITGRCLGTDQPPYELSSEGSLEAKDYFKQLLDSSEDYLRKLEADEVTSIYESPNRPPITTANPFEFKRALRIEIGRTERLIRHYKTEVKKLTKAVAAWEARPLPTEDNLNAHWTRILMSIR